MLTTHSSSCLDSYSIKFLQGNRESLYTVTWMKHDSSTAPIKKTMFLDQSLNMQILQKLRACHVQPDLSLSHGKQVFEKAVIKHQCLSQYATLCLPFFGKYCWNETKVFFVYLIKNKSNFWLRDSSVFPNFIFRESLLLPKLFTHFI